MSDHPVAHLFICVNEKPPGNSSCARNEDLDAMVFLQHLKEASLDRWGKKVRINKAGCLGKCSSGVVAVLYPVGKWYFNIREDQFTEILDDIDKCLA
jgi:(2Fe-2S) ferredoxin